MADADDLLDYGNDSDHEDVDDTIDEDQLLQEEGEGSTSILDVNYGNEEQILDYEPGRNQEENLQEVNGEEQSEEAEDQKRLESVRDTIPAAYTEDVAPIEEVLAQGRKQRGFRHGQRRGGPMRGALHQNGRGKGHLLQNKFNRQGGFHQQRPVMNRNQPRPPRHLLPYPNDIRAGLPHGYREQPQMRHPHPPRPLMECPPPFRPLLPEPPRSNIFEGPPRPVLLDLPRPVLLEGPLHRGPGIEPFRGQHRLPPPVPPLSQAQLLPLGGMGSQPQKVLINKDFRGGIIAPRNPPPVVQTSVAPIVDISSPPPLTRPPPSTRVPPPVAVQREPFRFGGPPPRLDFSRPPPLLGMTVTITNEGAQPQWTAPPPVHRHEALVHQAPPPADVVTFGDSQFERERPPYTQNDHYRSYEDLSAPVYPVYERENRDDPHQLWEEDRSERRPIQDRLGRKEPEKGRKNVPTTDLREKLSRQRELQEPVHSNLVQIDVETEESRRQRRIAEELSLDDDYLRKLKEQEELRRQILERKAKGIKAKATVGTAPSSVVVNRRSAVAHEARQHSASVSSSLTSRATEALQLISRSQTLASSSAVRDALPAPVAALTGDQGVKRPSGASGIVEVPAKKTKVRWKVIKDKDGNILRKIRLDEQGNEVEIIKFINGEPQPSVLLETAKQPRSKKIHISGLHDLTPDDVIEDACKHFGEVRGCLIFREPGQLVQADVTFEKEESAARFLSHFHNKKLDRNVVAVQFK